MKTSGIETKKCIIVNSTIYRKVQDDMNISLLSRPAPSHFYNAIKKEDKNKLLLLCLIIIIKNSFEPKKRTVYQLYRMHCNEETVFLDYIRWHNPICPLVVGGAVPKAIPRLRQAQRHFPLGRTKLK
jgi:hypothetical protein